MQKGPWYISYENQRGIIRATIRRHYVVNRKQHVERLPVSKYQTIRENPSELEKFITGLNLKREEELRLSSIIPLKNKFIDQSLIDDFLELLLTQIPTRSRALTKYAYLKEHFLNFYINKLNLNNPLDWYKVQQTDWAKYLKSDAAPAAASTKDRLINKISKHLS